MDDNYLKGCYLLFCVPELYLLFFQISGNLASFRGCSNIILKVKVNDALQILIIFNDILSQPWALARSKFFIFNDMSSYAKWNHHDHQTIKPSWSYMKIMAMRLSFLLVYILMQKKLLKRFAFSQKSKTNLPLTNKVGVAGNFFF